MCTTCDMLVLLYVQVLWSFMSGQGRTVGSFMGKGVIARASLAMSHLLHTTETQLHPPQVTHHRDTTGKAEGHDPSTIRLRK